MSNAQDNAAHTCSYSCDRPECIKAQRDELAAAAAQEAVAWTVVGPDGKSSIGGWQDMKTHDFWQEAGVLREGHRYAYAYAAPVTAAPGIDLRQFRDAVVAWSDKAYEESHNPEHPTIQQADRLLALIDASPKGSLNKQFGSAEGLDSHASMEAHYRQALERIASQGPHYGPDGTRETWQHWCDIARDALADSPKGGSEARDAERYRKLRRMRINPYAVLPVGDALDVHVDAMKAQAGGAEVQP